VEAEPRRWQNAWRLWANPSFSPNSAAFFVFPGSLLLPGGAPGNTGTLPPPRGSVKPPSQAKSATSRRNGGNPTVTHRAKCLGMLQSLEKSCDRADPFFLALDARPLRSAQRLLPRGRGFGRRGKSKRCLSIRRDQQHQPPHLKYFLRERRACADLEGDTETVPRSSASERVRPAERAQNRPGVGIIAPVTTPSTEVWAPARPPQRQSLPATRQTKHEPRQRLPPRQQTGTATRPFTRGR